MKKIFLLVIAMTFIFSSCEKDDICDKNTGTTPRLIIEFYDVTNPTLTKNVTNLAIVGAGLSTAIVFNGVSKIEVPLDIAEDVAQYQFILNYGNANASLINVDNLRFDYTSDNVYVSRACGYKTVFTLDATNPFTQTDAATPDTLWMQNITVIHPNILDENETHLTISF